MKCKVNVINKILRIIVQFASYILKQNIGHVQNFNFNGICKERVSCYAIRKFLLWHRIVSFYCYVLRDGNRNLEVYSNIINVSPCANVPFVLLKASEILLLADASQSSSLSVYVKYNLFQG